MDNLLLRPGEAADELRISRAKTYQLIADGTLPAIRIGGSLRVPVEALKRWVNERLDEARTADR